MAQFGMFVVDQTGTQGSYDYHIIVGGGGTVTQEYHYYWSSPKQTWMGFEVAIYGVQFGAYVQINSVNSSEVSVSYTYHDSSLLDFYAESNDNLWSGSSPWNVDGFVWFDQ